LSASPLAKRPSATGTSQQSAHSTPLMRAMRYAYAYAYASPPVTHLAHRRTEACSHGHARAETRNAEDGGSCMLQGVVLALQLN